MNKSDKKITISIDLMGGDNSPDKTLEGIDLFIKRNKDKICINFKSRYYNRKPSY